MKYLFGFLRGLLPLSILAACLAGGWWLLKNPPEAPQLAMPPSVLKVEAMRLEPKSHPVVVRSQGVVSPRTRSVLLPEVSGRVVEVASSFRPGGFFAKGDLLLRLESADYEAALITAKAEVAACEVVLAEETARAEQARENWRALSKTGEPSALLLRQPQLAKAAADRLAAVSRVQRAQRDIERTRVIAPYDGQVLKQGVDVGQFVNSSTVLGEVFAADRVEIRLPLPERESRFLALPQPFRGESNAPGPKVELLGQFAGKAASWQGRIVRVEGSLDEQTRQVMAVAQVEDPYGRRADGQPPLVVGTFVEARLFGQSLQEVYRIPRRAVRAGNEVILILEPGHTLRRVALEPLVIDEEFLIVAGGEHCPFKPGALLCLTPIAFPADGALVEPNVDGREIAKPKSVAPAHKGPAPKAKS
jgi:RND family efflux transporter MFP subunit